MSSQVRAHTALDVAAEGSRKWAALAGAALSISRTPASEMDERRREEAEGGERGACDSEAAGEEGQPDD